MNWELAELYSCNNEPQREWAGRAWGTLLAVLKEAKVKGRIHSVIDFGCGTGEITAQLRQWISELNDALDLDADNSSPEQIVGMDVSPEMVGYCRSHHLDNAQSSSKESKTLHFEVADAGDAETMKSDWNSGYDILVSFTAMHWVPDQNQVLQNINFVLKKDGFALLLIPVKAPKAFIDGKMAKKCP